MGEDDLFRFDELQRAFELRIVHMVMAADEVVHPDELKFFESRFNRDELESLGFLDRQQNCFTERFGRAIRLAPPELEVRLEDREKLAMLRVFYEAAQADGHVDPREVSVLCQAARMLGYPVSALLAELDRLAGVSNVPNAGLDEEITRTAQPIELAPKDAPPLEIAVEPEHVQQGSLDPLDGGLDDAARQGRLLASAGRVRLVFEAYRVDPRPLHAIPEVRAWLSSAAMTRPWLPAWLMPWEKAGNTLVAGALVAATLPCQEGDARYGTHFVAAAVRAANYAVAWTRYLGGSRLDHVYEYLEQFDIVDVLPGYFDGVEPLAEELDQWGRHAEAARSF